MKNVAFKRSHIRTDFIQLNTRKCKACWDCVSICSNRVIGKIDLPWHKHIKFSNSSACTGCLKCLRICKNDAIININ